MARLIRACAVVAGLLGLAGRLEAAGPLRFYSVTPCRIVDTRGPTGLTGGPALAAGPQRNFPIIGYCGIPSTAQAAALNLAVVAPGGAGHLILWPYNTAIPATSVINFAATDSALANGAVVGLTQGGTFQISVSSAAATHLLIDVTGYYAP